jgi:inner membrane protein
VLAHLLRQGGFLPFFYNWGELYGRGLIDGLEWRNHRFNWL